MRRVLAEVAELRPIGGATVARVSAPAIAAEASPASSPSCAPPRPAAGTRCCAGRSGSRGVEGDDLWLWGLPAPARLGDRLDLLGPLGRPFAIAPSSRSLLLLGRGDGLAPLLALADRAAERELA